MKTISITATFAALAVCFLVQTYPAQAAEITGSLSGGSPSAITNSATPQTTLPPFTVVDRHENPASTLALPASFDMALVIKIALASLLVIELSALVVIEMAKRRRRKLYATPPANKNSA